MNRRRWLAAMAAFVLALSFVLPVDALPFGGPLREALGSLRDYAREHVPFALLPAILIAGAIAAFANRGSILGLLGPRSNRVVAHVVAAISGGVLAVCSCSVLPLFAGIYRAGAGIGPAVTFLYAGPAINIMALVLTARVLGFEMGIVRAVAAIGCSLLIGGVMHALFGKSSRAAASAPAPATVTPPSVPGYAATAFIAVLLTIVLMMNWARSGDVRAVFLCCPNGLDSYEVRGIIVSQERGETEILADDGHAVRIPNEQLQLLTPNRGGNISRRADALRWAAVGLLSLCAILMLRTWFDGDDRRRWREETLDLGLQVIPLLAAGVLLAGLLLGRPGKEGLIPGRFIAALVGESPDVLLAMTGLAGSAAAGIIHTLWPMLTCLFAAVVGAMMYFATLTEVPILQGLMGSGMGRGPALALLLAGPAMSLPNMLVIARVIGIRRTAVLVGLIVSTATLAGFLYGATSP